MNRQIVCTTLIAVFCLSATRPLLADDTRVEVTAKKPPSTTLNGLPLVYHTDFEENADHWHPTDPEAWKLQELDNRAVFALTKKVSDYKPKVRSPFNQAILQSVTVTDFVLDVQLKSTEPDYNHRSLCLFFGHQDPSHFYYVHFGKKTDDHANQIFIVNDAPRTKISTKTTPGTNWDDEWHHARIVRDVESGSIKVYFDDMEEPVMTATDKTFKHGKVGIGSFDDRGVYSRVTLYGKKKD